MLPPMTCDAVTCRHKGNEVWTSQIISVGDDVSLSLWSLSRWDTVTFSSRFPPTSEEQEKKKKEKKKVKKESRSRALCCC